MDPFLARVSSLYCPTITSPSKQSKIFSQSSLSFSNCLSLTFLLVLYLSRNHIGCIVENCTLGPLWKDMKMFACSYKATMKQSPNHVFFRIKGHQLNLCFCISVFACFENIFWSACRAQVLTPLTFLPRSCLPRSFPERHNCTVAPKVLYLCFICLYLCILYSCICMFSTNISSLPRTCFIARWMTEKWSVYFCISYRFTFYVGKKTMYCTKA